MRPKRIEVEIERLVVDDPGLARKDVAAALQRELVQLARGASRPPGLVASSPVSAVARQIYARLGR